MQKPAVFEKTVEDHLKDGFKETYAWKPPRREDILKHSMKSSPTKK